MDLDNQEQNLTQVMERRQVGETFGMRLGFSLGKTKAFFAADRCG
jgi:hypothetical protein